MFLLYLQSVTVVIITGSGICLFFFFFYQLITVRTEVLRVIVRHFLWNCGSQTRSTMAPTTSFTHHLLKKIKCFFFSHGKKKRGQKKSAFVPKKLTTQFGANSHIRRKRWHWFLSFNKSQACRHRFKFSKGKKKMQLNDKKHSDHNHRPDFSMRIVKQQLRKSSSLLSPQITPTSLPLQTAISGLPVSAALPVCISSLSAVCARKNVCHCNVCVSSPERASHKQMGSWEATSHIVTEEIPFFCPRSWWHWWLRHTAKTRPEGGHHLCVLTQSTQMSTVEPPLHKGSVHLKLQNKWSYSPGSTRHTNRFKFSNDYHYLVSDGNSCHHHKTVGIVCYLLQVHKQHIPYVSGSLSCEVTGRAVRSDVCLQFPIFLPFSLL